MTVTTETVPFLDLVTQHRLLERELVDAFVRALRSAQFVGGPEVEAFESEFGAFSGVRACAGVNSGTDALRFAYMALGVRPGDEVITVAHTFIATAEAITQAGGAVRFVDIDERTMTMDPEAVRAAIGPRTVGIVPVHLYGQAADMDPILDIAARHGLWVVEDAAQAHGARYKGRSIGSLGAMAAFSFYPGKNLGSLGEGGAVTSNDARLIQNVRRLREHGQSSKYIHETEGFNGRLHAIQAAFLRIKLRYLGEWNAARRAVAAQYREALVNVAEVRLPEEASYCEHVYHLFVIRTKQRDRLRESLASAGIGSGLHYPVPLHLQKAYAGLSHTRGALPVTEEVAATCLSLPMFPGMSSAQVARVADVVRRFFGGS